MSANIDKQSGNALIGWIDERFPLTKMLEEHITKYYAPKNFNFWYYFGSLAHAGAGHPDRDGYLPDHELQARRQIWRLPLLSTSCVMSTSAG